MPTLVKAIQFAKTSVSYIDNIGDVPKKETLFKAVQLPKALIPTVVTAAGIEIVRNPEQLSNAP